MAEPIEERDGYVLLRLRVQPRASRDILIHEADGRLRLALTAPPAEGAANKAARDFLAKHLSVPRSSITLVKGEKSRNKILRIDGCTRAAVESFLSRA